MKTTHIPQAALSRLLLSLMLVLSAGAAAAASPSSVVSPLAPGPGIQLQARLVPLALGARGESAESDDIDMGFFRRLGNDAGTAGLYLLKDLGHVYTSPLRMSWTEAAWVGGALAVGVGLYSIDQELYDAMQDIRDQDWYTPIRHTGEFFEPLGTRAFAESWYLGGLAVGYLTGWAPLRDRSADMLEAIYLSLPMLTATKFGTGRLRPYQSHRADWGHSNGASFMSGHTSNIFLLAGVMAHHGDHIAWDIGAYTMATAVALERMTSSDHWPSDVYAGALWGWFVTRQMFSLKEDRIITVQPLITADGQGVGLGVSYRL